MNLLLLFIALVGHSVLWVGVVNRIHGVGLKRWFVDAVTFVSVAAFAALPVGYVAHWVYWEQTPTPWVGGLMTWYLVLCWLVAGVGVVARTALALHPERHGALISETREVHDLRKLHGEQLAREGVPRTLSRLPGNQLLAPEFNERELRVPRLPEELDGLRIAHLADLHMSGRLAIEYFEAVVELTLDAKPDLVALTGDLVEYRQQLAWVDRTLARLSAPEGVFFVLGNHDEKHDPPQLKEMLAEAGMIDLGASAVEREIRGKRVRLVGNELPWFKPAGDPRGDGSAVDLTIALAHGPDQFRWAEEHGVDLILAGHNHGGQIRFPPLGALVTPSVHGTRYNSGVFRRGQTVMHVTRGAGSLAPVRFFCRPEASVLVLRSGAKPR